MSRKKFVFRQKIVKISEPQQKKLDRLMEDGVFISEAEAFRSGLDLIYSKKYPEYLRPSPAGQIKQNKLEKEKAIDAIPMEEYVNSNLEDVFIFTDEDSNKWVLYRKVGNYVGAIQLDKVKDWVREADPEYNYHIAVAGDPKHLPYEKELEHNGIRRHLADHYGVVISYDPNSA